MMKFQSWMAILLSALAGHAMALPSSSASYSEDKSSPILYEALDLMARASSTSEVLTLNLTNLLILLVLKAFIFGFGILSGFGTAASASASSSSSAANARSINSSGSSSLSLTESDLSGGLCFLNYMSGAEDKFDCLRRAACEDPETGNDYLMAAKMWYKMHSFVNAIPFEDKYFGVLEGLEEAISHSVNNKGDCSVFKW